MMIELFRFIKTRIIVRWRIFQIRWGWHYNQRFMAHLITEYEGRPITFENMIEAQATHRQKELLKDDLQMLDDLPKLKREQFQDGRVLN